MPYQLLIKKAVFPILELAKKTSILAKLEFLEKSQWWTRPEIDSYQQERLKEIIRHAYENVPYYRSLFDRLGLVPADIKGKEDLWKIPILKKQQVKHNPNQFIARNPGRKLFLNFTSGTSFLPTKFFFDAETYSWVWALNFRAWGWMGFQIGDKYMKLSVHERSDWKKRLQDFFVRDRYIHVHNLNKEKACEFIRVYEKFKPLALRSYSSSLFVIAKYIEDNGIELQHRVRGIFTSGDNLFPSYRELIEKVFKCRILDCYGGGGEMLPVAYQCEKHGPYHLMEEFVVTELLDSGIKGSRNVVLSGLHNYAMPLIRYQIGDLASDAPSSCNCGRKYATMSGINGRDSEVIRTRNGENLILVFFASFFKYIKSIEKFQIIQNDLSSIRLRLVKNAAYTIEDERKIIDFIQKAAPSLQVNIEYVNTIADAQSGKPKLIISELQGS